MNLLGSTLLWLHHFFWNPFRRRCEKIVKEIVHGLWQWLNWKYGKPVHATQRSWTDINFLASVESFQPQKILTKLPEKHFCRVIFQMKRKLHFLAIVFAALRKVIKLSHTVISPIENFVTFSTLRYYNSVSLIPGWIAYTWPRTLWVCLKFAKITETGIPILVSLCPLQREFF